MDEEENYITLYGEMVECFRIFDSRGDDVVNTLTTAI